MLEVVVADIPRTDGLFKMRARFGGGGVRIFFRVERTNAIHRLGLWVVKTVPLYWHY